MNNSFLDTPIEYLKGVGPQRADVLKNEAGIFFIKHLLEYYPFRYIDRTKFQRISEISGSESFVQVKGKITSFGTVGKDRGKRLSAIFNDGYNEMELIWFQGIKYAENKIKANIPVVVSGRPSMFNNSVQISHPDLEFEIQNPQQLLKFEPQYNSTEKMKLKGLDSRGMLKLIKHVLFHPDFFIEENLSSSIIQNHQLISRKDAFRFIHLPEDFNQLNEAKLRLKFDELFFVQLQLIKSKILRRYAQPGYVFSKVGDFFNTFYHEHLKFELTTAQKRVIKEIRQDMATGKQMNRLLQGDVGSGKTLVALMCMLIALDNGFQACLMAPTEILANQHFETFKKFLLNMNVNVGLLTGSTKQSVRNKLHENLENGSLQILIGTHSLIEDKVIFNNLGLVVIDEQHRFGVEQRSKLWKKNTFPPHVLVMTATPIPRTLAMTIYGDLDTSVIDELPAGRKPIKTSHRFDSSRLSVWGFIKEQIKEGRQVYIVYPLIEESEKADYKDLMDGYESICRDFPAPEYRVSIVHGKMKPADKDFEMQRFARNETQIMVATTVIEVGVNVPNASVMVIESAERFGLSQLHQLRGRVGRGAEQSYCILMSGYKLSDDSKLRLETMTRTNDGFEIAEVDLKLRGPGDLSGTRQSGTMDFKLADLANDQLLVKQTREAAESLLRDDELLQKTENYPILHFMRQTQQGKSLWSRIS